jgi:hypothetical protein
MSGHTDAANHSAFQCLGRLILQIILLLKIWADEYAHHSAFQYLGNSPANNLLFHIWADDSTNLCHNSRHGQI